MMLMIILCCLVTCLTLIAVALWRWLPANTVAQWIVKRVPKDKADVSLGFISLYPLHIKHFTYSSMSLRLTFNSVSLDTSQFPYIHLEVHDVAVGVDPLLLQPIFDPSAKDILKGKTTPLEPRKLSIFVLQATRLVEYFHMNVYNIDLALRVVGPRSCPAVDVSMEASQMTLALRSKRESSQIAADILFSSPSVHVDHPLGKAVHYVTSLLNIEASYALNSSLIDGIITMPNKVFITLDLAAFLSFFNLYQTCEDNSIELKLMHGVPLTGKMRSMLVQMPELMVSAGDTRSADRLLMQISRMKVQLANSIRSYDEFDKCISVSMESFAILSYLFKVHTVSVDIRKSVNMISHIDTEDMRVSVDTVNMAYVDDALLDWLVILQHTADVLPSSRFNHFKNAAMHVNVASLTVAFTHEKCKEKLECHNYIAIEIEDMIVDKLNRHDSLDSHFVVRIKEMGISVELLLLKFDEFYSIEIPDKNTVRQVTRSIYHLNMKDLKTSFVIMDVGFALKNVTIDRFVVTEPVFAGMVVPHLRADAAVALYKQVLRVRDMDMQVGASESNNNPDNKNVIIKRMDASLSGVCVLKILQCVDNIKRFQEYISSTMDRIKAPAAVSTSQLPALDSDLTLLFTELNIDYHIGLQCATRLSFSSLHYSSLHQVNEQDNAVVDGDDDVIVTCTTSTIKLDSCAMYINGVTAKQFLYLNSALHSETQNFNISRQIVSTSTRINLQDVTMNFAPDMRVGEFTDTMLLHKDAIKKAMIHPKTPKCPIPSPEPTRTQFDMTRCQLKFFCAPLLPERGVSPESLENHANSHGIDCFAILSMVDIHCTIANPNIDINSLIGVLDDASMQRKYRYCGVMGGDIDVTLASYTLEFSQLKEPVICTPIECKGSLYMCAIADSKRIRQKVSQILLWNERSQDVCIYCNVISSEAPSKIYGDVLIDCRGMKCSITPAVSDYINRLTAQLDHILPPSDEPVPLMWWDSINYWMHGKMMLRCQDMQIDMLQQGKLPTPIHVVLGSELMEIEVASSIKMRCQAFTAVVKYAPNVMLGSRRSKYLRSSSSSGYPDNRNVASKICSIGALQISAAVTSCKGNRWNHHDIYHLARTRMSENNTGNDRFHGFRILRNTLTWDITMTCSDDPTETSLEGGECDWTALFLRLDIIDRLKEAFSSQEKSPHDATEQKNCDEGKTCEQDVDTVMSLPMDDILQSIVSVSMKIEVHRLMVCSWMNQKTTTGFVFCQDKLDVNFSVENGFSLQNLSSEISKVDVYVRDWSVENEECCCTSDLKSLFKALYKLMHTSNISLSVSHSVDSDAAEPVYSLVITDMRLLWTISMRNILYIYYSRFSDLFSTSAKTSVDDNAEIPRPVSEDMRGERVKSKRLSKSKMNVLSESTNALSSPNDDAAVTEDDMELLQLLTRKGTASSSERVPRKSHRRGARRMSVRDMNISDEDSSRTRALSEDVALPGYNNIGPAATSPGLVRRNKSIIFFTIQLLSPQINFLDEKDETSLLIVVSGESSVTGKHHNEALVSKKNRETPLRKSDVRLRMDGVSAFTANATNASSIANGGAEEENCVVYWKALASTSQENMGGAIYDTDNTYLKVAITDFVLQTLYTYYADVVAGTTLAEKPPKYVNDDLITVFMLDLPELVLAVTSGQFYGTLSVVRNVLLAPPPVVSKRTEEDVEQLVLPRDNPHALDLNYRACRNEIRSLIEDNLHNVLATVIQASGGGTAYYVEYFVGRGVWHLMDEKSVLLEIGFMGLYGTHFFHEDRCSTTVFEVQRFWVRDSSLRSTMESSAMDKPNRKYSHKSTVIAALGRDRNRTSTNRVELSDAPTETWVLMPQLRKKDACRRCGKIFAIRENAADSCRFHADSEGVPGRYYLKEVRNDEDGTTSLIRCWSCCGDESASSPGCCVRPHVCKELMLSIRAEAKPTVRIDDVDMTILQAIEISVFPGAAYEIQIFITRYFADVIHKYFAVEDYSLAEEQKEAFITTGEAAVDEMSVREYTGVPTPDRTGISNGHSSPMPAIRKTRIDRQDTNESIGSISPPRRHYSSLSDPSGVTGGAGSQTSNTRKEGIYVKYIRVGEINVGVSTVGFPINLEDYKAVVEPFVLHSKVLDWPMLLWKLEKHATWSVTKHTASNSMTKLYHFVFGKTAAPEALEDEDNEDDKVVMLLGVRRGSTTTN